MYLTRYPKSNNKSLKVWNAADELLIEYIDQNQLDFVNPIIVNDRFGFLSCSLIEFDPTIFIHYKSQEKSIRLNFIENNLPIEEERFLYPFDKPKELSEIAFVKIPKSLELFELQLAVISESLEKNATVLCGFMTRNFTPKLLQIAEKYFENVSQSLAKKKARLLILNNKKLTPKNSFIHKIAFKEETLKQYYGVFSSEHIDYATQFLLENLTIDQNIDCMCDLASGNGVIASYMHKSNKHAELHLVDDSYLATASSKMNITANNIYHHFSDNFENFSSDFFDLVVTNPPFHFDSENNIEITLQLFKSVAKCLKDNGKLIVVANKHLNYQTHLDKIYSSVKIVNENEKFIIYDCSK